MLNKVSWSAVLAGVVIALVIQLLLNMLGIGVGAATLGPATSDNPSASSFSIGAAIWWTVSGVLAAFAGGYAAGRLSGKPKEGTAGWHGLTTWALTTLVIAYLLSTAVGGLLGGTLSALTSVAGGVGSTAGGAVQTVAQAAAPSLAQATDPFSDIERSMRSGAAGQDPAALRDAAVSAMRAVVTGDEAQAQAARDRAADALARAQNIPPDQARQQIQQYEQQYRQAVDSAKQQAAAAADVTAATVSRGALLGFVALVLGAIASWFGGRMGAVDPTLTDGRARYRT
ncbi:PhnA-like protein [Chelatococcus sp. GCM10030263]|uniref:PhnA-like protein n=1 Tax=Chelatococcus sp. GCM10030263 TaxID=3273387 RepID=UPI003618DD8A